MGNPDGSMPSLLPENSWRADPALRAVLTSWLRPQYSPIYAICETQEIADSLTLNWAVTPLVMPFNHEQPEKTIELALANMVAKGLLQNGKTVVVVSSVSAGERIVDAVQMRTVD